MVLSHCGNVTGISSAYIENKSEEPREISI